MAEYKLAADTISTTDIEELTGWLAGNPRLTQGEKVREFEHQWARWVGTRYAVFVNSGSSANLLMYHALLVSGRLVGRTVIAPAVSWPTTVAPALQLGMDTVLCDADWQTLGVDMEHLEELCTKRRPAAVIVVHVLGVPVDLASLLRLREQFGFALLEDACAAIGSEYDGRRVGTFGDVAAFSFYFGHQISTIEGGMVCTSDRDLRDCLRAVRAHGWSRDLESATQRQWAERWDVEDFNRLFTFYYPGFNLRSTDLNARIGLSQMKRIDTVVARRAQNHEMYRKRFSGDPAFHVQQNDRAFIASIAFGALAETAEHRRRIARELDRAGIETRPLGGGNMSRQPFWRRSNDVVPLPVADRVHDTAFQLPNHPSLSEEDVTFICDTVLGVRP
jgi:CDP-4-dehydro-6-deoxyglucose reductase, E1